MAAFHVIAIIEDDDAVRASTAGLLRGAGHQVIVFTGGAEFLASDLPANLGCILLDMRMPGVDGLDVMRALKERDQAYPILVLTGHGDVPMAVEAMQLGAIDFLEKPYPPEILLEAIVHACEAPATGTGMPQVDSKACAQIASLSERQRAVLRGILNGRPNKIIAYNLGLSIRTVEAYRAQLLSKLGVRGTAEAVRLAMAGGMTLGEAA